ncbi:hypothetical protein E1B28_010618 [Marasmius oreades]|uniref:Aldehyde dehydrogenase domain-containing protein n=1 Tax=Marasmius oreades TaxID=181124 RepID=A0A9P7RY58_9AGAR|nr:uncharacterized protein E1B28_010618 [Marasmius oreades]KAG7091597.1 hypothetical protein E1B28_010618 [Marasmius oreades]
MSFKLDLDTPSYKGAVSFNTGLFIGGKWVDPVEGGTIDVVNPATGKPITTVSVGTAKDVDIAVDVAKKAFKASWGLKVPGSERGKLLNKLADLIEAKADEFAALETLNVGKPFSSSRHMEVNLTLTALRYFAGQAEKLKGETVESSEQKFTYTRREPYGVVAAITPWNGPLLMLICKLGPAVAAGNVVVMKPSEFTPLSSLKLAGMINEAGFPPGVINIINGEGSTVGNALSHHPDIWRISFTGSILTGRKIQEASAKSNLKVVTLELGGKSPNIIFDDCDVAQTAKWSVMGVYINMGQACIAGSRIYVQEGIYDKFLAAFQEETKAWSQHTGDPFDLNTRHGPLVSQIQFDRVMGYIDSAKKDGATILTGGERHGNEGYFVQPTIITDTRPDMKIIQEEIFGPVASIIKFKTEEEVIEMANNTTYGLACGLFTRDGARATRVAHALEAGTAWVNCYTMFDLNAPTGGYKQSGFGKVFGEEGIKEYTQLKSVHVNLGIQI